MISARSGLARSVPRHWFLGVAVLSVVGLGFLILDGTHRGPPVTVPAETSRLEPQLQAYIGEKVAWVRERPRDPARRATLATVYAANGLWTEALAAFEAAVSLDPTEPLGVMYCGVALQELGRDGEALEVYRQLTTRFPKFPQGWYRLANLLLRQGDDAGAETAYRQLTELAPNEWRGPAGLGEVALRRGQFAEAARQFERAVALDPRAGNIRHLLGLAYRGLGRNEDAEFELRLGLDSKAYPMPDPWAEQARGHMKLIQDQTEMASSLMDAGQAPAAVRMLGEALRFEPDNLSLQLSFARALLRADNPRGAERVLLEIAKRTPSNLAVRVNVSLVAQALGKTNEALAAADQALELATNNASAYLARANALLAMERDREALGSLETVARLDPQDAGVRVQIGDVLLLNLGQTNAALRSYQKASDVDPTLAAAQVRLAQLHIEAGRTNEARQAVARLKRIAPEDRSIEILESRLARAEKGKGS